MQAAAWVTLGALGHADAAKLAAFGSIVLLNVSVDAQRWGSVGDLVVVADSLSCCRCMEDY